MSKAVSRRFTTNSRILNELLTKYRNTFYAFCQLIDNSIQAEAKTIKITIAYSKDKLSATPIEKITILDDGFGVPETEFEDRIMEVGTVAKLNGQGVGRFAALQIGRSIDIETVAWDKVKDSFTKVHLPINVDHLNRKKLHELNFTAQETVLKGKKNSYYSVTINNLYHGSHEKLSKRNQVAEEFLEDNVRLSIFEQYPYEIFNQTINFIINGKTLRREEFTNDKPISRKSTYIDKHGNKHPISFYFYHVKLSEKKVSVFLQVENNGIKSVAHKFSYTSNLHIDDLGCRYVYVDSPYFSNDIFRNIDVSEMGDDEMSNLKSFIKDEITDQLLKISESFKNFTNKLKEVYPSIYDREKASNGGRLLFEKVAFLADERYKILEKKNLKDLIFPLLEKAITDGDVAEILDHVIKSDKQTTEKFKDLLQMSGLKDVVHFSHSVAKKSTFLDLLHNICYGKIAKHILERSQLHKIVEQQLWIFGESYNGTPLLWSDKNLYNTLAEIRSKYGYEPSKEEDNIIEFQEPEVNSITDLFFCNEKALDNGKREYMIVELKAPKCKISQKELNQIDRYAFEIEKHPAISSHNAKFKLYLISSDYSEFAKSKVKAAKINPDNPFLYDSKPSKNIEVYVLTWSDLLNMNRQKLSYMAEQLSVKDKSVSQHFEEGYSTLISSKFKAQLKKVK